MERYSGDYCTKVPPLPIPNREVKLRHADGTAYSGRVGSRRLNRSPEAETLQGFFVSVRFGSVSSFSGRIISSLPAFRLFPFLFSSLSGRLSEMPLETFSPQRKALARRNIPRRSERTKISLEEEILWNVVFRVGFSEEHIKKAGAFTPACENIN